MGIRVPINAKIDISTAASIIISYYCELPELKFLFKGFISSIRTQLLVPEARVPYSLKHVYHRDPHTGKILRLASSKHDGKIFASKNEPGFDEQNLIVVIY